MRRVKLELSMWNGMDGLNRVEFRSDQGSQSASQCVVIHRLRFPIGLYPATVVTSYVTWR